MMAEGVDPQLNVFLELMWGLPTPADDCTQKHPHLSVTGPKPWILYIIMTFFIKYF
jgi:hypothetical protein